MSKDKTHDEAKEALAEAKEAKKAAKTELKSFDKKNKVKKGDDSDLKKDFRKERKNLAEVVETTEGDFSSAKELVKKLKPKKVRESKYDYPEDVKGDPKAEKRYRASMRAKAKAADMTVVEYLADPEKGDEAIDKKKKSKKKDKKEDKKDKKSKKNKKEEVPEEVEDDDSDDEEEDDD